jgi:hypothetical protein
VRAGYPKGSFGYDWFTRAFERKEPGVWSDYATTLYTRLRAHAEAQGWLCKLRFLIYQNGLATTHAERLTNLEGVILQSKYT